MKFSQRIGRRPIRQSLQLESIDDDLKHKLWNHIYLYFLSNLTHWYSDLREDRVTFLQVTWHRFFVLPIDTIPQECSDIVERIRSWYYAAQWFEIFDFIEFLADYSKRNMGDQFAYPVNLALEEEMSGYRLIEHQVTPITDEHELREIESAIENTRKSALSPVAQHFANALDKLADRKNPDFRNSIKESISAVESLAKLTARLPKAELGDALKALDKKVPIHGALKQAFLSMYGYTSDGDGIRHAMTEQSSCDFEDAKFMLVACAAFTNYLIVKTQKAGISLSGGGA